MKFRRNSISHTLLQVAIMAIVIIGIIIAKSQSF